MADLDELVDSTGSGILDTVMQYGLFAGAIFQLICIFAIIVVPGKEEEKEEEEEEIEPAPSTPQKPTESAPNRSRRPEKKKRR